MLPGANAKANRLQQANGDLLSLDRPSHNDLQYQHLKAARYHR